MRLAVAEDLVVRNLPGQLALGIGGGRCSQPATGLRLQAKREPAERSDILLAGLVGVWRGDDTHTVDQRFFTPRKAQAEVGGPLGIHFEPVLARRHVETAARQHIMDERLAAPRPEVERIDSRTPRMAVPLVDRKILGGTLLRQSGEAEPAEP